MNEFHRDVLRVGGEGPAAERQQPPALKKAPRHFAARARQAIQLPREESLADAVSFEEPFFDAGCQGLDGSRHRQGWRSTRPGRVLPGELSRKHIDFLNDRRLREEI